MRRSIGLVVLSPLLLIIAQAAGGQGALFDFGRSPTTAATTEPATRPATQPTTQATAATQPTTAPSRPAATLPVAAKASPPSAAELKGAAREVAATYADDVNARTAAGRVLAAAKLLDAAKADEGRPAEQYALLVAARDLAQAAGDAPGAVAAVDAIDQRFNVDVLQMRCDAAAAAGRAALARSGADVDRQCDAPALETVADAAVAEGRFDLAAPLDGVARDLAAHSADPDLIAEVAAHVRERADARADWADASRASAAHQSDAGSRLVTGRFRCLVADDWPAGLPLLAGGADPAWAATARSELAHADLAAADAWWDLAAKQHALAHRRLTAHAAALYATLAPMTGLAKARVEQRLAKAAAEAADPRSGAVHRRVDLLRLIDLSRDSQLDPWRRLKDGGGFASDPDHLSRLVIPYAPPAGYDERVTFSRASGNDGLLVCAVGNGHPFAFGIAVGGNAACDFSKIAHGRVAEDPTRVKGKFVVNGRRYTAEVRVRPDGVEAYLDGHLLLRRATDFADMSTPFHEPLPRPDELGLHAVHSGYTVYSAVLIERVGVGAAVR